MELRKRNLSEKSDARAWRRRRPIIYGPKRHPEEIYKTEFVLKIYIV